GVTNLSLEIIGSPGQSLIETMMQKYQSDLASIGVTLKINIMEAAQWVDQANNAKYNGMYFSGDNNAHVNPGTLWSTSPGWRPVPFNNSAWDNAQWKDLVNGLITE